MQSSAKKVTALPVYSKLAAESDIPPELGQKLPPGFHLSQHQLETYLALTAGREEVIFNLAITADGKSLAGQLPALVRGGLAWSILALYPTNELIADQFASFGRTCQDWGADVIYTTLNSATLDHTVAADQFQRRGQALLSLLQNNDLILSNPDIIHYLMHQFYTRSKDAPDRYFGPLIQKINQLTYDEFHIFDAPQIVSVLNSLLLIHETSGQVRPHKFLFLSATPGELMLQYLQRSGLRVREIQGTYAASGDPAHWRQILRPAGIHIASEPRAEAWIEQHLEDTLLPFFLERRPNAKGAIIVNSVASAYRILARIQPIFERHGLKALPNTGLTSRSQRKASYEADLLVGTSTVDVGVDFQINFLLFESLDAGTFLQRLGRLGRHAGFTRDGQFYPFQAYAAYALVPPWIEERFFQGLDGAPPPLADGAVVDRLQFNQAVQDVFPPPPARTFEHYARCWGKFQSIKILAGLNRPTVREQYRHTRQALEQRYDAAFGIRLASSFRAFNELADAGSPLLAEALSFRGNDEFPCCVIDQQEPDRPEQFKNTDLLRMIANFRLVNISAAAFYAAAEKAGLKKSVFEDRNPLGFFNLHGVEKERENIAFFLDLDVWGGENFGKAIARRGFRIDARFDGYNEINAALEQRLLPSLLVSGQHPLDLKRRLGLPALFPLHAFQSRDGITGAVAFGRSALMLEARLLFHPLARDGGAIIL